MEAGFANGGKTCFANAVLQVLLRLPAVAIWLSEHSAACELPQSNCLSCTLWASRVQLGRSRQIPALVQDLCRFLPAFADGRQHGAEDFLATLLDALRAQEVDAKRCAPWTRPPADLDIVTHVDRIFGFVEETRLRCTECQNSGHTSRYSSATVLQLPLPAWIPMWT